MRTARRTSRARRAGFTLVEVMVSLGVMTVGAMAIIGLQTQTMRANIHSRHLTTAMQIAQIWAERLKQDAALWTQVPDPSIPTTPDDVVANTLHLSEITANLDLFTPIVNLDMAHPTGNPETYSDRFTWDGRDVGNTGEAVEFCVDHRLNWVFPGHAMRVDVRVWWKRESAGNPNDILVDFPNCVAGTELTPGVGTQLGNYHTIYLPVVIRAVETKN